MGGYPELHAPRLAANTALRGAVRAFAQGGGFVFAECGGLMFLSATLHRRPADVATARAAASEAGGGEGRGGGGGDGEDGGGGTGAEGLSHEMCGLLPFDVSMT